MLIEFRCMVLRIREFYYRKMWLYCMNKTKKCECDRDYQEMYEWKEKASNYHHKRKYVTERLWSLVKQTRKQNYIYRVQA